MKIIVFGWVKVVLPCFKQITLYTKQNFRFLFNLIDGERLLLVVLGVTILSDKKPADFHNTNFAVPVHLFKV